MRKLLLVLAATAISIPSFAQKTKKQNDKALKEQAVTPVPQQPVEDPVQHLAMEQQKMLTPMHRYFPEWAGHWRDEMKILSLVPGRGEPSSVLLDRMGMVKGEGRFLTCEVRGAMNGKAYEAYATYGYDNIKRKFIKTWFDNSGTGILVLEGDFDEKNNTIDFRGTTPDPVTRQPVKIHQVLKIKDPNNQVLEIYIENKEGKEIKTMEVISKRG